MIHPSALPRKHPFVVGLFAMALATVGLSAAEPRRPNVLFLFTDDQRSDTIAALGNPAIQTPHLDSLARSGFAFTSAYCFGSNVPAVCLPSRNMLLSGRAYFRFGKMAPASAPNLPASLKQAGYQTYHHGKRGNVALEIQKLFETNKYLEDNADRTCGEPGKKIVDEAVDFLKARDRSRPFFLYLAFANPHDPRVAARGYLDRYDVSSVPLPPSFRPFHPFDNGDLKVRDEKLAQWPRTEDEIRRHLRDYYAVMTALDGHIGRLLRSLEELGEKGKTIIIFSSDNGLAIGSHGLMGKQSLYEHSVGVPLVFCGPGIPRGKSDAFVYLMDIFPTICDLLEVPVPAGLDGVSQAPVIRGEKARVRESAFGSYRDSQRSVRQGPWKLIRYPRIHKTQLFNLQSDPEEMRDLSGDPVNSARIEELLRLLRSEQERFGDSLPSSAERPERSEVDLSFFAEKPPAAPEKKKAGAAAK